MPKGKHKGGRRCFTNFSELKDQKEKEEKERAWRKARGEGVSDSEEEGEKNSEKETDSSEESEQDEEHKPKAKGTEGLIEIENPNYVSNKSKKVSSLNAAATPEKPQPSRKEREEAERQRKAANYRKLHAQGKTEEARADLERLALIKKQREEAQKRKEDERKTKEAAVEARKDKVAKALNKKDTS